MNSEVIRSIPLSPQSTFRLIGRTDSRGTDCYNDRLGQQRVLAVAGLLQRRGADVSWLEILLYGEHRPVADNRTADGRQRNRQVAIERKD